jgi:hypothetical protein
MSGSLQFQRAVILAVDAKTGQPSDNPDDQISVHFNPETLRLQYSNNLQADTKGSGKSSQPAQLVDTGAAKLSLDLLFDTTLNYQQDQKNADVRKLTQKLVSLFIRPPPRQGDTNPPAARSLVFVWGTFIFNGLVESMSETLDFFAAAGVPLRASVSLSLAENRYAAKLDNWAPPPPQALATPPGAPLAPSMQAAGLDPSAWRQQAMLNGLETPRFSGGSLAIGASVLASASASLGVSADASASAGFSAGASADLGTNIPGAFSAGASAQFTSG